MKKKVFEAKKPQPENARACASCSTKFLREDITVLREMRLEPIKFLRNSAGVVLGGFVIVNVVSMAALGAFRFTLDEKRKKSGLFCQVCRGKGFYICKLCKGNATISWSPLYDPVCINPVLYPTCDGHRFV